MIKIELLEQPFKDVFHDVPEGYVRKVIELETKKEEKRVKSRLEKLLLFLKLKKPWVSPRHVIYHSEEYMSNTSKD